MPSLVAAGFVVFRRLQTRIEYLLLQVSYGEHHWTPPKGHTDPGESEFEAAVRETQEEAGLTPDQYTVLKGFTKQLNYEVRGNPKKVVYWLSELKDPNTPIVLSNEHQDYKWLSIADVLQLTPWADMQEVYKDADKHLCSN